MRSRPRRGRRLPEAGLTLIEAVVTIAVMSIGVLGLALSLSSVQLLARAETRQSQLAATVRLIGDTLRSSGSTAYIACASAGSYNSVLASLALPTTENYSVLSLDLVPPSGANYNASGFLAPCSGTPDWGLQRISIRVTDNPSGQVLNRVVYKMWHP